MCREHLLTHADDSDPMLLVFLKLFELLASCCDVENLSMLSICRNVIGPSELLKVHTYSDDTYLYGKIIFAVRFYLLMNLIHSVNNHLSVFYIWCTKSILTFFKIIQGKFYTTISQLLIY